MWSSPMLEPKQGKKRYFEADFTDGKKRSRMVGFKEKQQKVLSSMSADRSPVKIKRCEIQESMYTSSLEIKLTGSSMIEKSPVKFNVNAETSSSSARVVEISGVLQMRKSEKVCEGQSFENLQGFSCNVWKINAEHSYFG